MLRIDRDKPPPRWVVQVMLAIVAVSIATQLFGDAIAADFVERSPAGLIALNPRNRNLLLATNQLDALTFYSVAFARLVATDPIYYFLGYWYGDKALAWVKRRSRTYGPLVDDGQDWFRRLAYPIIFFAPNNIVCLLSGATGMGAAVFLVLNITGTITRLVIVRMVGEAFSEPIDWVLSLIAEYRTPLLILSGLAVAWTIFGEFRGDNSEVRGLAELTSEDGADAGPSDQSGQAE